MKKRIFLLLAIINSCLLICCNVDKSGNLEKHAEM